MNVGPVHRNTFGRSLLVLHSALRISNQAACSSGKLGNVPLSVPASHKRFRTWGGTRLIDQPGRWQAVVRADDGTELARASFDVES